MTIRVPVVQFAICIADDEVAGAHNASAYQVGTSFTRIGYF
jgi:hypothetical protein